MQWNWLKTASGLCAIFLLCSCAEKHPPQQPILPEPIRLIVLDPGHYHAALVQKTMYEQIDPRVHVYAPNGPEVRQYLKRIDTFNRREDDPTDWQMRYYVGPDYIEKMLADKAGDVVVLSGNNQKKTQYITAAVDAGLNVYADKPMCIDASGFEALQRAFATASDRGLILYDIMTERFNKLCMLQKAIVLDERVFGELQNGSPQDPAVIKESVHHFFKTVAGTPLQRPIWYFDTDQQGEGLVDVTTHLIDLVLWTCFPQQPVDCQRDVTIMRAKRWPTRITRQQYEKVTGAPDFPDFLQSKLEAGVLLCYSNGEMVFRIRGVHVKLSVSWDFQAPPGGGDTHHSVFKGSRAHVIIRQGKEQDYEPRLYVEPADNADSDTVHAALRKAIARLEGEFGKLKLIPQDRGWQVVIPPERLLGHEAHFRQVTERYLHYLAEGKLPEWEVAFMKTKYYITTQALKLAKH